jgi:hypothetical protein
MTEFEKKLKRLLNKQDKAYNEYINHLSSCPHERTSVHNRYIEGGYYDRAEYWKEECCDICHKVLKRSDSEYGSYA